MIKRQVLDKNLKLSFYLAMPTPTKPECDKNCCDEVNSGNLIINILALDTLLGNRIVGARPFYEYTGYLYKIYNQIVNQKHYMGSSVCVCVCM